MAVTDFSIGGTVVAQPIVDGIRIASETVGQQRRMANGALKGDYVAEKSTITVRWEGLSVAERAALRTAYTTNLAAGNHTLVLPDGASYTAQITFGSWDEQKWFDRFGNPEYDITIAWKEA